MNTSLAAVGIPVYNGGQYIGEALRSLKNQSFKNWICIIVNNCSTDNTVEVVKEIIENDDRFILYNNDVFLTAVENWNRSFELIPSNVSYFKILPCDDWLFPDFLQEMIGIMETYPSIGVCSSFRLDGKKVSGAGLNVYDGNFFSGSKIMEGEFRRTFFVTGSLNTVMYKVDFLKKINGYPKIFNEKNIHSDSELCYDLLNIADFGFVYKILSYTRRHEKTLTFEAQRRNTYLLGAEYSLLKYCNKMGLLSIYIKHRMRYAYFLLGRLMVLDTVTYHWHLKRVENKFTAFEFIGALIYFNPVSVAIRLGYRKIKNSLK